VHYPCYYDHTECETSQYLHNVNIHIVGNRSLWPMHNDGCVPGTKNIPRKNDVVPGACKAVEVRGQQIAVFNIDGTFYASLML